MKNGKRKYVFMFLIFFTYVIHINFNALEVNAGLSTDMIKVNLSNNTTSYINTALLGDGTSTSELSTAAYNPFDDEDSISTYSIIGSDDRTKVQRSGSFPNTCTARLRATWPTGAISYGTAFMVAPRKAITAGHCLYNDARGGFATEVRIWPGRNTESDGSIYSPFGHADATYFTIYNGWAEWHDYNYDAAIINLDRPIGNRTGHLGLLAKPSTSFVGKSFRMTGYSSGSTMRIGKGTVTTSTYYRLGYNIDTENGTSGAPVYRKRTGTGWTAYAIHGRGTGNNRPHNGGVRITRDLIHLAKQSF